MEEEKDFVPALGVAALTPLYQVVVDAFCRDTHVKKLVVSQLEEQHDLKILDIACGTGKLVKMIAAQQKCCSIVGQDLDPLMVKQATENNKEFDNVRILEGNATDLSNFDPDSFDVVIESLVFHHLSDEQKRAAISEISRVLTRTGVFYFIDWIQPKGLYAKLSFKIVKVLDGSETTEAHETNQVLSMIEERFIVSGESLTIQTSVGTIGLIAYGKKSVQA